MDIHSENKCHIMAIEYLLQPTVLNIYPWDQHLGIIEKSISNFKEQTRSMCHNAPYK